MTQSASSTLIKRKTTICCAHIFFYFLYFVFFTNNIWTNIFTGDIINDIDTHCKNSYTQIICAEHFTKPGKLATEHLIVANFFAAFSSQTRHIVFLFALSHYILCHMVIHRIHNTHRENGKC